MTRHPPIADPALRHLINEYLLIREKNRRVRAGEHGGVELLLAEGTLILILIERFLRLLLGSSAGVEQTLPNLLDLAMSDRHDLLDPPLYFAPLSIAENCAASRDVIVRIRNPLLHGNYEQAAEDTNPGTSVEEYFSDGSYRSDLDSAHQFFESMLCQFDLRTGARRQETMRRRELRDEEQRAARQQLANSLSRRARRIGARG